METTVKLKHLKQSATKIRFVLNQVTGLRVNKALDKLTAARDRLDVLNDYYDGSSLFNKDTKKQLNG